MKFHLKTKVLGSEIKNDKVILSFEENGKPSQLECDVALVCIGRIPNTNNVVDSKLNISVCLLFNIDG